MIKITLNVEDNWDYEENDDEDDGNSVKCWLKLGHRTCDWTLTLLCKEYIEKALYYKLALYNPCQIMLKREIQQNLFLLPFYKYSCILKKITAT